MGSTKSRPGIFITINKSFYLPGELVQGNIYINAPKAYPSSRLLLNIKGSQKTFWKSSETKTKKIQQTSDKADESMVVLNKLTISNQKQYKKSKNLGQDRMGQAKIIEISYTLCAWSQENTLHGQYSFPFTFHLPSYLPASFKDQTTQYKASIEYEMSCISISPKKQYTNLIQTKQIVIRSPSQKQSHALHGQLYLRPKSCCCCSLGVSKISCYLEKNQYKQNQQCTAYCQIDNIKGNFRIKLIKVKLNKMITLLTNQGQQITFIQQLNQTSFPGINANNQYIGQNTQKITFPLKYKKSSNNLISPSTNGKLIKCQYVLQLTPILAGCCINNKIYFNVSLQIVQEGIKINQIQAPSDWNPQIFGKSEIFVDGTLLENDKLNNMINPYY